jgi:hypothetical protein
MKNERNEKELKEQSHNRKQTVFIDLKLIIWNMKLSG